MLFCRTPPSNHFSHDVLLFFFFLQISEVCGIKSIYLVEQGLVPSCSYGNQVKMLLSSCGHICTNVGIPITAEVEEKEALKNLLA